LEPFGGPFFDTFEHFLRFVCHLFRHEFWHGLGKRFLMDFRRFWGAFETLFGSLFRPERENEKVCLDCTGVYGLHIQLSKKSTFAQPFPAFFSDSCAGGHFAWILVFWGLPWGTRGHHFRGQGPLWGGPKKRSKKRARPGAKSCTPGDRIGDCAGPAGEYERASLSRTSAC